ncbi:hypothetical protein GPALN_012085 [Globodera pallida]|nr:hypothetical protein GPALN_012085 [Globodera pallida]
MGQQFLDTVFTRGSHNWGMSVVLVTQHLFAKELRVARNNSHYLVLMRNPAGALQMRYTMRMFLVPEDFLQAIVQQPLSDGTPISHLRSRIQQVEQSKEMNEDEKAAQYHQEFKRLNKLVKEKEEQPLNRLMKSGKMLTIDFHQQEQ